MSRYRVPGRVVLATFLGEFLLIGICAYWYAGMAGLNKAAESPPSISIHLQFAPTAKPLGRSYKL